MPVSIITEYLAQDSRFEVCFFHTRIKDFRHSIFNLLSLYFVPETKIRLYYNILKDKILESNYDGKYSSILSYFEKNYINISGNDLKFLNVHKRVKKFLPRTTNCLEGWHKGLNGLFVQTNPTFVFLWSNYKKNVFLVEKKSLKLLKIIKITPSHY
jgi:hypothetical protein